MRITTMALRLALADKQLVKRENAYALLRDPRTGITVRVYLTLAYDTYGRPYFVPDQKAQAAYEKQMARKFPGWKGGYHVDRP